MSESRPVGEPDAVTRAWWDATRERRLLVQRCEDCGNHQHYPRAICTACGSLRLSYDEASGWATVYSFTTVHRAPDPAFTPPYVVALVRLEEGPMLLTNVVGDTASLACDDAVRLVWEDLPDGRKLPLFAKG